MNCAQLQTTLLIQTNRLNSALLWVESSAKLEWQRLVEKGKAAAQGLFWLTNQVNVFPKNEKANISKTELKRLKGLSDVLFDYSDDEIDFLTGHGQIKEIGNA